MLQLELEQIHASSGVLLRVVTAGSVVLDFSPKPLLGEVLESRLEGCAARVFIQQCGIDTERVADL